MLEDVTLYKATLKMIFDNPDSGFPNFSHLVAAVFVCSNLNVTTKLLMGFDTSEIHLVFLYSQLKSEFLVNEAHSDPFITRY